MIVVNVDDLHCQHCWGTGNSAVVYKLNSLFSAAFESPIPASNIGGLNDDGVVSSAFMIQGFGTVHSTTCSSGVDVKVSKVTTREGVCEFPKYPLVSILSSYLIIVSHYVC